ncbi:MAG TPA: FAD-binding oxidoreductase, partial [Nevskiales bacterium]|nr:FAD-binding oxidoreductase [Nevskiales bacterium]
CHDAGLPVIPQGGNTGRCGGAVPSRDHEGIVLSLRRLARIRAVDPDNYTLTAEAGCILADIQRAAATVDRLFPLSLGAEGSCQIGGNLASNAGGLNVLRYGNARELTLGLEVVLADGRVWDGLNGLRKNNTGYDLRDLFIGSEGTLGIITAATLKLFPRPQERGTALLALGELEHCVALLALARAISGDAVTSFELLPRLALEFACRHIPGCRDPLPHPHGWYVLIELVGHAQPTTPLLEALLEQAHARGLIVDAVTAASQAQADALWRLREAAVEAQRFEGASIKHDVSVPVSRVPAFIRAASRVVTAMIPGVRVYAFGHVGDGNVHYNLSQPKDWEAAAFMARREELNRAVHDVAMAMGGSFSAEHGIGQLKLGEMARYKSPVELQLMYALKRTLDPRGILNPGKVLPPLAGPKRGE